MEKYIRFVGDVRGDIKDGREIKICTGLGNWKYLKQDRLDPFYRTARPDNVYKMYCIKTGQTKKGKGLILIDFDNNERHGKNGNILFNILKAENIINEAEIYFTKTPHGGYHVYYECSNDLLEIIKSSTGNFNYENEYYSVDIKANGGFGILPPTKYEFNGQPREYVLLNNKLTTIPDKLKDVLISNTKISNKQLKTKENDIQKTYQCTDHKSTPLDELKIILDNLSDERSDKRDDWIFIGMALKYENPNSLPLYIDFSKRSKKYTENEPAYNWNTYNECRKKRHFTLSYLIDLLKKDNRPLHYKLYGHKEQTAFKELIKPLTTFIEIDKRYIGNDYYSNDYNILVIPETEKEMLIKRTLLQFIYTHAYKVFSIKSHMNTGKTYFLKSLLKKHTARFKTVLYLTHRVDFSLKIYGDLKEIGFDIYTNKDYKAERLICTVDSLNHVLSFRNKYDLIILDELESILFQFNSPTIYDRHINNKELYDNFVMLCNNSEKIIAMDADYAIRGHKFIQTVEKKYIMLWNNYNTNEHKKLLLYYNEKPLISKIIEDMHENRPFCCIEQSKTTAEAHYDFFRNEYVKYKIEKENNKDSKILIGKFTNEFNRDFILHTCETSDAIKKQLINVNELWKDKKGVFYTPTIDVGISYDNDNHFNALYVFTCPFSSSPRTLFQGMQRIRDFKDDIIRIYIHGGFKIKNNAVDPYTYEEYKALNLTTTDDPVFILNELENLNKQPAIFINTFLKQAENSGYFNIVHVKNELITPEKGKTLKIKIETKIEKLKKTTNNYAEINALTDQDKNNIRNSFLKNTATQHEKEIYKFVKFNDMFLIRELNDTNIYFHFNNQLSNLLLLNGQQPAKNTEQKRNTERITTIKKFIELLGFSIHENKILSGKQYEKNAQSLLQSDFYKSLEQLKFNVLFNYKKTHKNITEYETKTFNKFINSLFSSYGIKIDRSRTGRDKKTVYNLVFLNGSNEIINNYICFKHKPYKHLYETDAKIYKPDQLRKKDSLFDNEK